MCLTATLIAGAGLSLYQAKRAADQQPEFKRPPTIDPEAEAARLEERRRRARGAATGGFGTAATNMTGPAGLQLGPVSAKGAKTLLGM